MNVLEAIVDAAGAIALIAMNWWPMQVILGGIALLFVICALMAIEDSRRLKRWREQEREQERLDQLLNHDLRRADGHGRQHTQKKGDRK